MRRALIALPIVCACASAPVPSPPAAHPPEPVPSADATLTSSPASAPTPAEPAASTPQPPTTPAKTAQGVVAVNDVMAPKEFDPNPILKSLRPKLADCYKAALAQKPSLHGKLKTRVVVLESGKVDRVEDAGKSTLDDASVQSCAFDAIKAASFPKPGGTATITFTLFFH